MPILRQKPQTEPEHTSKVSIDMLRNAEVVDETTAKSSEKIVTEEKSMEAFNKAEIIDETPTIDFSDNNTINKIEPEIKVSNGLAENDVIEKFKKVQDSDKIRKESEFLLNKNQQLLSENSKLKLEIDSLRRSNSDAHSLASELIKIKESELMTDIAELKKSYSNLKKDYQLLTEIHKEAIINTPDKQASKPVIEEKVARIKKSKVWEPPTHNPYKSFSKKYRM